MRNGKGGKHREVILSPECRAFMKRFLKAKADHVRQIDANAVLFLPQRGSRYTSDGIYRVQASRYTAPRRTFD